MPRNRWLLLAALPFFAVLIACGGGKDDDNAMPGENDPYDGGPPQVSADLQKVIDEYTKVKSFRARLLVEGPGVPSQQGEIEVVMPDRFHAIYESSAGVPNSEIILIGTDTYFRTPDGWIKQAAPQGSQALNANGVQSTVQAIADAGAAKEGWDSVNGKNCQVYAAGGQSGRQEICVADNLPLRYSLQSGEVKTTLIFSDYNKSIDIKAPI